MIIKQHSHRILVEDEKIDWTASAETIYNHIRGLSPWPVAYTQFEDGNLKVFAAHIEKGNQASQVQL